MDKCLTSTLARKCDIILSIHRNGSRDNGHDGTLVISALTEAYYVTTDAEALAFRDGNRVAEKVEAQYAGLADYFANKPAGGKSGHKPR
ncbi:MAG: hypothetical protein HYV68_02160 [Candidatus Taylorbacteria bacterium]|nr:hypothetical protein [Candidatus Taylorbacteria bacterium]